MFRIRSFVPVLLAGLPFFVFEGNEAGGLFPAGSGTPPSSISRKILVKVREREGGRPVPRASVLYIWTKFLPAIFGEKSLPPPGTDPLRLLEQKSRRALSNSKGVATLTVGPSWGDVLVTVKSGSSFGWRIVKAWESRVEVLLGPCPDLKVRVEKENGKPARGVRVGLRGSLFGRRYLVHGKTGREGTAVFRKAPFLVDPGGTRWTDSAHVTVEEALAVRVEDEIRLNEIGSLPMVLPLPPTGKLAVRVLWKGKPLWNGSAVVRLKTGRRVSARRAVDEGGTAFFKYVGLGMEFGVDVSPPFFESEVAEKKWVKVKGPTRAGERVGVDISLKREGRYVTGSMIGPGGAPFSREWVFWHAWSRGSTPSGYVRIQGFPILTDGLGRFLFPLYPTGDSGTENERAEGSPPERNPGWWICFTAVPAGGFPWTGDVWVSGNLSSPVARAGKVRFSRASLLAGGRVLDGRGRPLAGAKITAYTVVRRSVKEEEEGGRIPSIGEKAVKRFREVRIPVLGGWTYTGRGGRFQVRGDTGADLIYLEVVHPRSGNKKVFSIRPGEKGLKLLVKE